MRMPIQDAIQDRWDSYLQECQSAGMCLTSIFEGGNDPGKGKELFKKSFGLVWGYFQELMSGGEGKSTLLLIAPPYRRTEILECVLRILVASEVASAEFMTPDEIRKAWETRTQVMLCFKSKSGSLRRIAYTPKDDDVCDSAYAYHYGRTGKCWFNPEKIIVLRAETLRNDGRITNPSHCVRGSDENLFGEYGLLKLKKAIVIVGNKSGESVAVLKSLTVGGRSMWEAFSGIELSSDGACAHLARGNGIPSIIVAKDYSRLGPYFESTEGRYDQFHCIIYDDRESIKENGTDGMADQIVIRSSETIIRNLFNDPAAFNGTYKKVTDNGCLFIWDRLLDASLRDDQVKSMKEVTIVEHKSHHDIWINLPSQIRALRRCSDELQEEGIVRVICWVYKQLHLPKIDTKECREALGSLKTNDPGVTAIVNDLMVLIDDFPDGETEKMTELKRFLSQQVRPNTSVGILSRTEDSSVRSLIDYGQSLHMPRKAARVSAPCAAPVRTIAYRKMSMVVANRYWLFDSPNTNLHWFLYQDEIDALDGQIDLLDDLETRHVASRSYRARILGVAGDLLYEFEVPASEGGNGNAMPSESLESKILVQDASMSSIDSSLKDSIARFLSRDVVARVRDYKRESSSESGVVVRIRFEDNIRVNYARAKVLVLEGDKRSEVDASKLVPGQKVFLIRPEKARQRAERLYGSPDEAAERWRSVLRRMMDRAEHPDYLAAKISYEVKILGLDRDVSTGDLRRYGANNGNATELPYNSASKAAMLFRAIGIIGGDDELSNEQYARGLAGVIQDAHSQNRTKGRGFMEALRRDWLAGNNDVAECFSEKTVLESCEIDEDDILTEE